jgi:RsiW-degrading membrane proteinase PrsW (M82 family)
VLIPAGLATAVCAVLIMSEIGPDIGAEALAVGLAAAVIPVPVLVLAFLWLGRYEPEHPLLVVFCLSWGAFTATYVALQVNGWAAEWFEQRGWSFSLVAVLVAPVIEELMKFAGPLVVWLVLGRRGITGITKGIVYCGLSATGFAMVENILYLGGHGYRAGLDDAGRATGLMSLFAIFIVRILMSGFAHPLFTTASGIGLGLAVRTRRRAVRWLAPVGGVLAAMLLHGTWNLMAVLVSETGQALFFLYGYVALMLPLLLAAVGFAIWLRSREGRITQRVLPEYARAGWLSPPEVASLASLSTRHSARRWARRVTGEPGRRAMRGFQRSATRLALLRDDPDRYEYGGGEERALLERIGAYRAVYVGRDRQVPLAWWDGQRYEIAFPDGTRRAVDPPAEPVLPVPVELPPAPHPTYPAPQR